MNIVEKKSVKIPKNMRNKMLIPHVNKKKKEKGLFSDRKPPLSLDETVIKNNLTNIIYKNKIPIKNINHGFDLAKRN